MSLQEIIGFLEALYKPNNYWTIQKIHNEYIVGLTPFNGHMVYGKGETLELALADFIKKL